MSLGPAEDLGGYLQKGGNTGVGASVGMCPRLYGYTYALDEVDHGHGQLVHHLPPGIGWVEIIIGGVNQTRGPRNTSYIYFQ